MKEEPWAKEIHEENASPPLFDSFRASAIALNRSISAPSRAFLEHAYLDPYHVTEEPVEELAALLAAAGMLASAEAAKGLLGFALDEHHDPFSAIAAQALDSSTPEDQRLAVELLQDLANRANYAEAAAILSLHREHLRWPSDTRERWRAQAAAAWPPSVRGLHGRIYRTTPFGTYYVAHVLAS